MASFRCPPEEDQNVGHQNLPQIAVSGGEESATPQQQSPVLGGTRLSRSRNLLTTFSWKLHDLPGGFSPNARSTPNSSPIGSPIVSPSSRMLITNAAGGRIIQEKRPLRREEDKEGKKNTCVEATPPPGTSNVKYLRPSTVIPTKLI